MKHFATIQTEFLKEARKWNDLSLEEQRVYLKRHPKSKRQLTAKNLGSTNKTKMLAKAKRFAILRKLPDDYENFFDSLKQIYPNKKKLINELQSKIEDINSVNYMARYEKDSKDKTQQEKLNTKKLLNKMFKYIDNVISKL
jgi:hypothetical protein